MSTSQQRLNSPDATKKKRAFLHSQDQLDFVAHRLFGNKLSNDGLQADLLSEVAEPFFTEERHVERIDLS